MSRGNAISGNAIYDLTRSNYAAEKCQQISMSLPVISQRRDAGNLHERTWNGLHNISARENQQGMILHELN